MARKTIHFAMALHAHQPTGNFDHVFRESFEKCYAPLVEELERHPGLPMTLHYSGILLEWFEAKEPGYLDRLKSMTRRGQVELLGSGFGEPILVMLSDRDRRGQIRSMADWLEGRFGVRPRGAWLTERVWEQCLASDMAEAGVEFAVVDDSHFRLSGLRGDDLLGSYVTEDRGRTFRLFPSSEALRYHIPFRSVEETIRYFESQATESGDRLLVYGDDTEKFGSWPGTHEHVYEKGWLSRFFTALEENREWLRMRTLSDALALPPLGRTYIPDTSYREMTEWALPTAAREEFETLRRDLGEETMKRAAPFFRGGNWRTFLSKYPESGEMYGKMMDVSRRVALLPEGDARKAEAEMELYRGQTNCAYWHGVFGGLYLPHLRFALYRKLIAAEKIAEQASGKKTPRVEVETGDYDFDGALEARLASDRIALYLHARRGGHAWEIDDRKRELNLTAGMTRRREPYHADVADAAGPGEDGVASIHDRAAAKEEGLGDLLVYDRNRRESLVDHFFAPGATLEDVSGPAESERGDFHSSPYEMMTKEGEGAAFVRFARSGSVVLDGGIAAPVRVEKEIALKGGASSFTVRYVVRNEGRKKLVATFGVEFAFALLAGNAPDRYLLREGKKVGPLESRLDLAPAKRLAARDEWLGLEAGIVLEKETPAWIFPVKTVSLSEGGFEAVYQSTIILPRWKLALPAGGEWTVTIEHFLEPAAG